MCERLTAGRITKLRDYYATRDRMEFNVDDLLSAVDGDELRPVGLGAADEFGKPRLGVLEEPAAGRRAAMQPGGQTCLSRSQSPCHCLISIF